MGLARENIDCLEQGIALLEQLDDGLFAAHPPGLEAGTVGAQFRHVIDYYDCLLRDLDTGRVDYDRRSRRVELETRRSAALAALRRLVGALATFAGRDGARALRCRADRHPEVPGEQQFCDTSLARELMFLSSHTVHHFAIIAVTLQREGFEPPSGFGVAPSTLRYWKSTAGAST